MEGFIVLHRSALQNPVFNKPFIWHYFMYCCLRANWKDNEVPNNGEAVLIKRGSFMTSLEKDQESTGLTIQNIRTARKNLQAVSMIVVNATKAFSIIEVCNYSHYQDLPKTGNKAPTKYQQRSNKVLTTNNKENKENTKNQLLKGEKIRKYSNSNTFRFVLQLHCRENGYEYPSKEKMNLMWEEGYDPKNYHPQSS